MYYQCRSCGEEKSLDGCLPSVSCGLFMMVNLGIAIGVASAAIQRLSRLLDWWVWLGFLPLTVGLFLAVTLIPQFFEWLWAMGAACPRCHKRRWSWPFTRGFGL